MSGNGDLKNQDDKDSDGAEVSSPTSQDQNPFVDREEEVEEEEKRDAQSVQSFDDESKSAEQTPDDGKATQEAEGEGVVEIVRELKSEEVSESQKVSIEYVESTKVSGEGGSSEDSGSSSSSSSDDESQVTKKSSEVVGSGNLKVETYNSVSETAPVDDLVKPDFTLSEGVSCDTKSAPVDEVYNSVVETASVVDSVKPEVSSSEVVNLVLETTPVGDSVKPYASLSEEVTSDAKGVPGEEAYKSAVETASVVDLVKPEMSVSGEVICVTDSAPLGNSVAADVVELGLKENEEKKLPASSGSPDVSPVMVDLASKKTEDKVFPLPDGGAGLSSTLVGSEVLENEDEPLPSSDAPSFETSNGVEHVKNSEVPECSEKQVLPLKLSCSVLVFLMPL